MDDAETSDMSPDIGCDATPLAAGAGEELLRIARRALELHFLGCTRPSTRREPNAAGGDDPSLDAPRGVFVTLRSHEPTPDEPEGRLRGCVGQLRPSTPLRLAVAETAVDAALRDTRFPPVTSVELESLAIEVTVLSLPKPVGSWREIRAGEDGIILEKGQARALFLPQVATEQGWDLERTLGELCRKAGLARDGWREGARFEVFTGQVFQERKLR